MACRMLGFKSAQAALLNARFGSGLGTIWFDDFICEGNEESLLECSHAGVRAHNCRHSEDASVICSGEIFKDLVFVCFFSKVLCIKE